MISKKYARNNKAAISIEAAIVLPIFIVFVGALYMFIFSIRVDLIYQEAGYSAVRELELLLSLSDEKNIKNNLSQNYKERLRKYFENKITAKSLSLRQNYWFKKNINLKASEYFIQNLKYKILRDEIKGLEYEFSYSSPKMLGGKTYSHKLPIPYWGGLKISSLEFENKEDDKEETSIWSEHNFKRGKYFREKYGANLPFSYPVIAKINGNTITSIMSLDLTAPTYQNYDNLLNQVNLQANKLMKFKGTKDWGKEKITIDNNNIRNRKLLIIIPENSDTSSKLNLNLIKKQLNSQGITIEIIEDGVSKKFE